MYSALRGSLHPSQTLVNIFREPQGNFLDMQTYLGDRARPYFVLLSDLAKAFERVNPHGVLRILQILNAPVWVLQCATYVLFGRSVRHRIGHFYRPPIPVHQGADMGRAVSVLLFCVAMDPIYVVLNAIPGVLSVKGYMDDNATCGADGLWLSEAQRAFTLATTAGFQVLVLGLGLRRVRVQLSLSQTRP